MKSPVSATIALVLLSSCTGSLSPLSHKLKLGEEPYFVFAADGEDGQGDLFASPAVGGQLFQFTFTRLDERLPRLAPDGSLLVFARAPSRDDSDHVEVWVMNLINGAERRLADAGATRPLALAWSPDARTVYIRTGTGILSTPAPPAAPNLVPVEGSARPAADSAFSVPVGDPPQGEVMACPTVKGLCLRPLEGPLVVLDTAASQPVRWGADSVAYLLDGAFVIRPLGGGKMRALRWTRPVGNVRELTYFEGNEGS
jgi:hypothetical protein